MGVLWGSKWVESQGWGGSGSKGISKVLWGVPWGFEEVLWGCEFPLQVLEVSLLDLPVMMMMTL